MSSHGEPVGGHPMHVDVYEKAWMWAVAGILGLFFLSTAVAAFRSSIVPPSHVETIDPARVLTDPRFRAPGVFSDSSGHLHARIVGLTFAWLPATLTLPANVPVTFHVTSTDVTHGFEIVRTNGQAMVVPGYVSQFTTRFTEPGEYLIACNEYCGVGHHLMAGKLTVVPAPRFRIPPASPIPAQWTPSATTMGGTHVDH